MALNKLCKFCMRYLKVSSELKNFCFILICHWAIFRHILPFSMSSSPKYVMMLLFLANPSHRSDPPIWIAIQIQFHAFPFLSFLSKLIYWLLMQLNHYIELLSHASMCPSECRRHIMECSSQLGHDVWIATDLSAMGKCRMGMDARHAVCL